MTVHLAVNYIRFIPKQLELILKSIESKPNNFSKNTFEIFKSAKGVLIKLIYLPHRLEYSC